MAISDLDTEQSEAEIMKKIMEESNRVLKEDTRIKSIGDIPSQKQPIIATYVLRKGDYSCEYVYKTMIDKEKFYVVRWE